MAHHRRIVYVVVRLSQMFEPHCDEDTTLRDLARFALGTSVADLGPRIQEKLERAGRFGDEILGCRCVKETGCCEAKAGAPTDAAA